MAQSIETLSVKLTSDTSEFSGGLEKAKESTSSFSSLASGALMGVGMAAFNMAASAATSFVGFASDGINMASDLNETVSKVQTVFGDNATAIQAWAASAATSMGQTSSDALAAAAGFGNLFVSMGLTKDSSADMSMNLVQLATDLGSFNNMSTDEALQKLKAGMLGSAEPLQSLGVNMNAAMVSAKALEMGLAGTTAELTPAMLAQARYALILEQTKTAQGDFAKTSDGLANQQKIADAQWKELQTTLGTAFLPVMLAVTKALNNLLKDVMPPLSAFIKDTLSPAMTGIADAVGPSITKAIGFFKQMFDTVGPIISSAVEWIKGLGTTMKGQADGPMSYMSKWFDENMPRIQKIVDTVLTAITGFWNDNGEAIMRVVNTMFGLLVTIFDTAFKTIGDSITFFLKLFTGDFKGAGETLAGIVERLWGTVATIFGTAVNGLMTIVTNIDWLQLGKDIVQGIANGIGAAGQVLMSAVDTMSQNAWDKLTGWWQTGSPSKLADKELGQMVGMGFGIGIPKGLAAVMPEVTGSMNDLFDTMASANPFGPGSFVPADATMPAPVNPFGPGSFVPADALMPTETPPAPTGPINPFGPGSFVPADAIAPVVDDFLALAHQMFAQPDTPWQSIPASSQPAPPPLTIDWKPLIDRLAPPWAPSTGSGAGSTGTGSAGNDRITIIQNFYGPTSPDAVEAASLSGVKAGLRARGVR